MTPKPATETYSERRATSAINTSTPQPFLSEAIPFPDLSHIPNHGQFIQLMLNAKAYADLNQSVVTVKWRGNSTLVEPNLPPFTKEVLKEKILTALNKNDAELNIQVLKTKCSCNNHFFSKKKKVNLFNCVTNRRINSKNSFIVEKEKSQFV